MRRAEQFLLTMLAVASSTLPSLDCKSDPPRPPRPEAVVIPSAFDPVALPDPKIAGFRFPESAETVARWAASDDVDAAARHAWGLWTALMTDSGESFEGQPLRVFETWFTTRDLLASVPLPAVPRPRVPHPLGDLEQLHRIRRAARLDADAETPPPNVDGGNSEEGDAGSPAGDELLGFVKFDPVAAEHVASDRLLSKGRLQELVTLPVAKIPDFPNAAIVVKAVYQTLSTGGDAGTSAAQYSKLASWTGPPDPAVSFPPSSWTDCVWIDRLDPTSGTGNGEVDTRCAEDGSSRTPATTYGLGRFVHFTLSATEAAAGGPSSAAANESVGQPGDVVVLIAMHITTRESPEWTWETYWWTPTPDEPAAPSSAAFAAARPAQLSSAARNYAGCTALSMLRPPPPSTGGSNVGESVYCFNPWLEAKFGPKDLPDSQAVTWNGVSVTNDVGVQSNCMSCHAQANYSPPGSKGPDYTGDRYVDRSSAEFNGTLLTDFLWSIPDSATDP
jgi:hypothetical protein